MFTLIAGKEGSGKTKTLIELANSKVKASSGSVIFIDDNNRHMYDLHHDLRFISMNENPIRTPDEFFGFLVGLMSNNYDIETIYIDGLTKVVKADISDLGPFVKKAEDFADKHKVQIFSTINCDAEHLPDQLKTYVKA